MSFRLALVSFIKYQRKIVKINLVIKIGRIYGLKTTSKTMMANDHDTYGL